MALINQPPATNADTTLGPGWAAWFSAAFMILTGLTASGTTANRPTKGLWVGRPYFDSTLGYNVYYDGTGWVDGNGSPA